MIGWGLLPPPAAAQFGCLDEIREFRARVLYDAGRRPAFRDADGCYADRDPLDRAAYHVYARVAGAIVGSVRLLPVPARDLCLTEQLIGPARFAQMLRTLNVNRVETIEGGRWVVDPAHRVGRLGGTLKLQPELRSRRRWDTACSFARLEREGNRIACWHVSVS